jgi:hypothetical protein
MKPSGAHTHPGHGGDGLGIAVAVLVVLAVIARPAAKAAGQVVRVVGDVLEITGIVLVSVIGLAVLAGLAVGACRLHQWRSADRAAPGPARGHRVTGAEPAEALSAPNATALEQRVVHLHIHVESAADAAAVIDAHREQIQ